MRLRAGQALADLELAVLGIDDRPTRAAGARRRRGRLMGEGPERDAAARRGARLAPRDRSGRAADPAAGPLARRYRRLAHAARLLVGGEARAILAMSRRIDKSWVVFDSIENAEHDRCVDLFRRPDGSFGFEEFRRDVEDAGAWTPVAYYSGAAYSSKEAALGAAVVAVVWLGGRVGTEGRKRGAREGQRHRDRVRDGGRQGRSRPAADHGPGRAAHHLAGRLVPGAGRQGLLRRPLRQPRHRPVDRFRRLGRAQHRRGAAARR